MAKVAFSWDGNTVVRAGDGGEFKLYSVPELNVIWEAKALSPVLCLAWQRKENALILTGHLDELCFWEPVTGQLMRQVTLEGRLGALSLSKDGRWLASYNDLEAMLILLEDPQTRYAVPRTQFDNEAFLGVWIRPEDGDGPPECVLLGTAGALWNWQPATGQFTSVLAEPGRAACWSRVADLLLIGTDKRLLVMDGNFQHLRTLAQDRFQAVAFSPGNQLALACGKQTQAWEVDTARPHATYRYSFQDLEVASTGEYAASSLGLFSMATGKGRTFWGQVDQMPTVHPAAAPPASGGSGLWTWIAVLVSLAVAGGLAWHLTHPPKVKSPPPRKPAKVRAR